MGIVFSKEDDNYDKENGCKTVLLLGNGFDLQLGLKSRYEDFLLYLFFLKILHQLSVDKIDKQDYLNVLKKGECLYYNNEICQDGYFTILDIAQQRLLNEEELYGFEILNKNCLVSCLLSILSQSTDGVSRILGNPLPFGSSNPFDNLIPNNFYLLDSEQKAATCYIQDKTAVMSVDDIESKLRQYIIQIKGNSDNNPSKINGWMDIESIIECLLTKNQHLLTRFSYRSENYGANNRPKATLSDYCNVLNLKDNLENAYQMREALKQFTHEFCMFIQIQVDHVKEQEDLVESLKIELNKEIELYKSGQDAPFIKKVDLFSNIRYVLNYNYSSLSELFQEYSNNTLHVNGKSEDETAIFGINEDTCFSQNCVQQYQEQQNKYCTYFFKQSQRVLKHVLGFNYENLISLSHGYNSTHCANQTVRGFNLIIYGHSCSPADFDVIKTLLTHPNLRVAVVLCYNKEAMLSAYHNIRTMLGPQKIAEMMQVSSKMEKRLFFLERKES